MKSFSASKKDFTRNWYYIDATGKILGRLSSIIAHYLRGKHKSIYTPNVDVGDYIIVINASKIHVTGKKFKNKLYYHHTGHVGGLRKKKFSDIFLNNSESIIKKSVYGMLPKGPLGKLIFKKLKVYSQDFHNHKAQKPRLLKI
ncbi:50S ribosomal protein L13 [Buchnera aphidicola]|uniref:50S ribosomal protein L13 n=1 Tax=Buchnera aphidicola TaxID=9 RepID=UPI0022388B49|nr:50S ribosomal protein L13 [Buchnera aphidicola]MCW5197571.1 50S ribosomal protein L13 [Buchnera aphidicola (Chaitophorus viminalis)]